MKQTTMEPKVAKMVGTAVHEAISRFFEVLDREMTGAAPPKRSSTLATAHRRMYGTGSAKKPPAKPRYATGTAADGRRMPAETKRDAEQFAELVRGTPGEGIRWYGRKLGMSTAQLAGPVAYAVKHGLVRREGQRSATRYYPPKRKGGK